jgi:hypothetical protein
MSRRRACFLLVGLVLASTSFGQTPSFQRLFASREGRRVSKEQEARGRISKTFDRVERAFEASDPDAIEPCLAEKRIFLSLKARGEEAGYYGRSQVKFMLAKLFRERRTDSFRYDPEEIELVRGDSAFVRAEWSYVALDRDDAVTEELRFKLDRVPEEDDWRVSEIRAQNR